ncbi:MAG: glycosyltransferase family 4 protein [Anaerolineae bacterium]
MTHASNESISVPRLLHVTTFFGTMLLFLVPFARYFRSLGWQVDGAAGNTRRYNECAREFDNVWLIPWGRNPLAIWQLALACAKIRSIVIREGYDIVHVHTPVAAFVTRFALSKLRKQTGLQVIYTAHGFHFHRKGSPVKNLLFLTLEKLAGRWTDQLIVINHEDERAATRFHIVDVKRIHYIPGIGVDLALYSPQNVPDQAVKSFRSELGLKADDSLLLMVGEFNPGKRHRDALYALASLGRKDIHLALAGSGRLVSQIRSLAERLHLEEQVHFLGFRPDVPVLMRASQAVLLPSEREGLARCVMEAMALEVPVIGADSRGIRDLIENGGGILYPVGDVASLAKAIAWVLENQDGARAMSIASRERVSKYDIKHILKTYDTLYQKILDKRPQQLAQSK